MATVTRENIGLLNDKLTVKISKEDYLPAFEQSLKKYAKNASIPGFRKGMVPSGLIKKMYGPGVFTDEVLRTVEKELSEYLTKEQVDIFGQPLPLENDARALDMNNPSDYAFAFEIGLQPKLKLDTDNIQVTLYKVMITNEMLNEELEKMQFRFGKMTGSETVSSGENILNLEFTEIDETGNEVAAGISKKNNTVLVKHFNEAFRSKLFGLKKGDSVTLKLAEALSGEHLHAITEGLPLTADEAAGKTFKMTITQIELIEKAELNEDFFQQAYPDKNITTEAECRAALKAEMENYYAQQSRNHVHDQLYHHFVDRTPIDFPEPFLKKWLQSSGDKPKTAEEAEKDYPDFARQLKWTLVSSHLLNEYQIEVTADDVKTFAKQQLFGFMGMTAVDTDQPWIDDYVNRMLKDTKFLEDTYNRISTDKLFKLLEEKVKVKEEEISLEDFSAKLHHHHH